MISRLIGDDRCRASLRKSYTQAGLILAAHGWCEIEGEIPQTGEEDPLAMVDDPGVKRAVAAKMSMRRSTARPLSYQADAADLRLLEALDQALGAASTNGRDPAIDAEMLAELDKAATVFVEKPLPVGSQDRIRDYLSLLAQLRSAVEHLVSG